MDQFTILKVLESSPKGRLPYDTGWDQRPNAITALINAVQEFEIEKPKREIVENAFRITKEKERSSLSPKPSLYAAHLKSVRGRYSLPGKVEDKVAPNNDERFVDIRALVKTELEIGKKRLSLGNAKARMHLKMTSPHETPSPIPKKSPTLPQRNDIIRPKPEFHIEEVSSTDSGWSRSTLDDSGGSGSWFFIASPVKPRGSASLLTPPGPSNRVRRKKGSDESPNFKPSPYASSTHTQTHSSTSASEATTVTPTRKPYLESSKSFGIRDEPMNEEKLEEDILLESKASPFSYIEECQAKYLEDQDKRMKEVIQKRVLQFKENDKENIRKASIEEEKSAKARRESEEMLKKAWAEKELADLQGFRSKLQNRQKTEEQLHNERKSVIDLLEKARQQTAEAEAAAKREEQLRIQKAHEDDLKRKKEEAENLEKQRLQQEKETEVRRIAQAEAIAAKQKVEDAKNSAEVVPELSGLILKEDLVTFAKSNELLKQFEDATSHIDGKDPVTKTFYVGAVKCINTPLNALADTNENEIMSKVQHFSKLLSGEPVSGGGSMTALFSSKSIPHGDLFVTKTLAFRFVKKAEADVTRGRSTVQPLATVGVQLCKIFPVWGSVIQGYLYRLCPFLVPFSYPQGDKSVQDYARVLGHELSGSESAIQQTFLERIKGYCTLYALMILKFHNDGPFEIGDATDFFSMGNAWQILAKTMKLDPQIDVTATVIHTLLEILDDSLYRIYKQQFTKLIRLFIMQYLPKIKAVTPPAKSGSISRLQIYLEKKYAIRM